MILFRADGGPKIGMGHIMRCMSIAAGAMKEGEEGLFVLSNDDCKSILEEKGHKVQVLSSDYAHMEPGDLREVLATNKTRVVLVDSYFVTREYMSTLQKECREQECALVYMDDRCEEPYACDYLVNYNIFADRTAYESLYKDAEHMPVFLLGSTYAPLRKEFQKKKEREVRAKAEHILISTGGADAEHLTLDILEEAMGQEDYTFHFVLGAMNLDREKIADLAKDAKQIVLHERVARMDELMESCDVAVSAAGSTLYELCATQTPAITYVLADNQIPAAEKFHALGILKNCGDIRELGGKDLAKKLIEEAISLAESSAEREHLAQKMRAVVDGDGAMRLLDAFR